MLVATARAGQDYPEERDPTEVGQKVGLSRNIRARATDNARRRGRRFGFHDPVCMVDLARISGDTTCPTP